MTAELARPAHAELLTDRFEESLDFFERAYGLTMAERDGSSAWLRV